MQHNLQHLLDAVNPVKVIGPADRTVTLLTDDSRKVTEGAMFVAVRGVTVDGHSFIPSLADRHPAAIVVETMPDTLFDGVTYIQVPDSAIALGCLASQWYDNPSRKLKLVGVTGTNGKTTTATLIYEMARLGGHKAGLLSTVCNYIDTRAVPARQTTPD
ncbi:MAG: UDP-N-acetylmuramoyl-L-alanyl-D-glutamate--2,6-diaminopimelate ligase, partial [Muribaculaceae bacterium]|nr:UDP-N-acetylmuramoyl-L-alanyl-D-glutamate--2,6-diaminopimelate ligase [Muribaculaceae bacterium]